MLFIILIFIAALVVFLGLAAFCIRKTKWSSKKQKLIFSFVGSALIFPVFVPAGTISVLPLPNIVLIFISLADFDVLRLFEWYGQAITFSLISYFITLAILGLMAQVIFFEYKKDTHGR